MLLNKLIILKFPFLSKKMPKYLSIQIVKGDKPDSRRYPFLFSDLNP
jgi:hypothetical protein